MNIESKKHILLVASGYPSKQFVLEKLQELGYYVIILDAVKTCPDILVNDWILADLKNTEASIAAVKAYLSVEGNYIDGALTFWENAVPTTARIIEAFNWIGNSVASVEKIKNKYNFRSSCVEQGLPAPACAQLHSQTDIQSIEKQLHFPLVVKPVYGAMSAFVTKVDSAIELTNAYVAIQKYFTDFSFGAQWQSGEVYVEEYIDGQEVDIDILMQNGEIKFYSISDNFQTHEPYFVETGQAIPSKLSHTEQDNLLAMAQKVLSNFGVVNGCVHFEAKYSSRGPIPIEINLRMGGDEVYSFVKHAWHVDLVAQSVKIALGEVIDIHKPESPYAYLEGKYFLPTHEGRIQAIVVDEVVAHNPNVLEVRITKKIGDTVSMPPKDFDYFGWITTIGPSAEVAHQVLLDMFPRAQFVVEPKNTINQSSHIPQFKNKDVTQVPSSMA